MKQKKPRAEWLNKDEDARLLALELPPRSQKRERGGPLWPKHDGQRAMVVLALVLGTVAALSTLVALFPLEGTMPRFGFALVVVGEFVASLVLVPFLWRLMGPAGRGIGRQAIRKWPATVMLLVGGVLLAVSTVSPVLAGKMTPKVVVPAPVHAPSRWFFAGPAGAPELLTRDEAIHRCTDRQARLPSLDEVVLLKPPPRSTQEEGVWLRSPPADSPGAARLKLPPPGAELNAVTLLAAESAEVKALALCVQD